MRYLVITLLALAATACSSLSPAGMQCRSWQARGLIFSTLDSCIKCVENLGSATPESVQGCAVGLDAGALIDSADGGR